MAFGIRVATLAEIAASDLEANLLALERGSAAGFEIGGEPGACTVHVAVTKIEPADPELVVG